MAEVPSNPTPSGAVSDDIDLYCLNCGYNLRGLSGDPRRCPECGFMNPMGDLEIPAPIIRQQLRKMETGPTLCVAAVLVMGVFIIPFILATASGPGSDPEPLVCCGPPIFAAVPIWFLGMNSFRASCQGKRGWGRLLWRFHCYGVMLTLAVGLPIVIGSQFFVSPAWRQWKSDGGFFADAAEGFVLVLLVIWVGLLLLLIRWGYAQAKRDIEPMQRDVAVEIARTWVRQRLASQRRWGRMDQEGATMTDGAQDTTLPTVRGD